MRPFIPAPNTARVTMVYDYNDAVAMNVLHFRYGAPFDVAHLEQLCGDLVTWWENQFQAWFTPVNGLSSIEAVALDEENSPGVVYGTGLPAVGTGIGEFQMPGNVTTAVTARTAFRGRSYRGRVFHVGLLETGCSGNRLTGGAAIWLFNAYNQLVTGIAQGDAYDWVVVSYQHNNAWRTTAAVNTVQSVYVDDKLDSQRRRLSGRGI